MNQIISNDNKISTFKNHWEGPVLFTERFNTLFQSGDASGLMKFLEHFSRTHPLYRDLIRQAYNLTAQIGISSLANECARIYTETCTKLLKIGRTEFGLPTIFEFNHRNEMHSELVEQAAFTKILLQLGKLTVKPVLSSPTIHDNPFLKAFLPYLNECFEIIPPDSNANVAISQIARFAPYVPLFYKFSNSQYGHNSHFIIDCYSDLVAKDIEPYPFVINESTIETARIFLKPFAISEKDDFVVFYLREEGYFDSTTPNEARINVEEYTQAINYFLQKGLKVVRLGHSKMQAMDEQTGLIDLTNIEKPYEVDIYLCAKAKLYFGSGSGPISLARNFGIPCCETACIDFSGNKPNSLSQYLLFQDAVTAKQCTFSQFKSLGLVSNFSLEPFISRDILPSFPNSEANLEFAKESLDFSIAFGNSSKNKNYSTQKTTFNILGDVSSSSLPLLQ